MQPKTFSLKTRLQIEKLARSQKNQFFGQNFFSVHFLLSLNVHVWNQYKNTDFFTLIRPIQRKKIFIWQKSKCVRYFLWTKKSKMRATTQYFVKRFIWQILGFHRPSKILQYARHLGIIIFGPYWCRCYILPPSREIYTLHFYTLGIYNFKGAVSRS